MIKHMTSRGTAILLTAVLALALASCTIPSTPDAASSTSGPVSDNATGASPKAKPKAKPKMSVAQNQAVQAAQSYVDLSGFSKAGLIGQLTSKAGNGFKRADAVYAVNHIKVNWNAEAVESAKSYLDMGGFSRSSLIDQLHSSAGSGFTLKQATYAANKVGL